MKEEKKNIWLFMESISVSDEHLNHETSTHVKGRCSVVIQVTSTLPFTTTTSSSWGTEHLLEQSYISSHVVALTFLLNTYILVIYRLDG